MRRNVCQTQEGVGAGHCLKKRVHCESNAVERGVLFLMTSSHETSTEKPSRPLPPPVSLGPLQDLHHPVNILSSLNQKTHEGRHPVTLVCHFDRFRMFSASRIKPNK